MPRWAAALLSGLVAAALGFGMLRWLTGLDPGLSALVGLAAGAFVALLVARWFAAAEVVLGVVEVSLSALVAILSIIAAIIGALS
jgi:hypothetical protein